MAKLILDVDDSLLSKALIESQEQQVSLDTFINEALAATLAEPNSLTCTSVNVDVILQNAVERVRALPINTEFLLVEICSVQDWEALGSGERKSLGKNFRKEVEGMGSPIAKHVGRTNSNKAIYKRI